MSTASFRQKHAKQATIRILYFFCIAIGPLVTSHLSFGFDFTTGLVRIRSYIHPLVPWLSIKSVGLGEG